MIQTRQYRSPEVILRSGYGPSADIWSTACLAFELATGEFLFDPHSSQYYSRNEDHLARIIRLLGPIPENCLKGKYIHNYFTKSGQLMNFKSLKRRNLEELLVQKYDWNPSSAKSFADFLLPMLHFDPQKRSTALQSLNHSWIIENSIN
jgi:serine/threonine protein kinase